MTAMSSVIDNDEKQSNERGCLSKKVCQNLWSKRFCVENTFENFLQVPRVGSNRVNFYIGIHSSAITWNAWINLLFYFKNINESFK